MKSAEWIDGFNVATVLCAEFLEGMAERLESAGGVDTDTGLACKALAENYRQDAAALRDNVIKTSGLA